MSNKPENPPAFPSDQPRWMVHESLKNDPRLEEIVEYCNGMTLRDYFAGQALTGILSRGKRLENEDIDFTFQKPCDEAANIAFSMAESMLKARVRT